MINMRVNSEQSFENDLYNVNEVLRKRYSQLAREYFLIVELVLDPSHQEVNIFRCANFEGRFHIVAIRP